MVAAMKKLTKEQQEGTRESRSEANAARTREFIHRARELLKPSEVRLHHVPNWFRLRMLKAFGCSDGDTTGWDVLHRAVRIHFGDNAHWLDHFGSTKYAGSVAFASEPYEMAVTPDAVARLDAFTEKLGIKWHLSANSFWYPGWTIRILLYEPGETEGSAK